MRYEYIIIIIDSCCYCFEQTLVSNYYYENGCCFCIDHHQQLTLNTKKKRKYTIKSSSKTTTTATTSSVLNPKEKKIFFFFCFFMPIIIEIFFFSTNENITTRKNSPSFFLYSTYTHTHTPILVRRIPKSHLYCVLLNLNSILNRFNICLFVSMVRWLDFVGHFVCLFLFCFFFCWKVSLCEWPSFGMKKENMSLLGDHGLINFIRHLNYFPQIDLEKFIE